MSLAINRVDTSFMTVSASATTEVYPEAMLLSGECYATVA